MGGFMASLFGGQSKTLDTNIPKFGAEGDFAQQQGQGDTTAASNYYQQILSGDPSRQGQALAPETAAANETAQQEKNKTAQFGTRGGGTGAATAGIDANTHAELIKLLGGQQAGAAAGAASLGTNQQGIALGAQQAQDAASQQQMQNWMNSILGKGITGAVQVGEAAGMGAAGGALPGGPGASAGAQGALSDVL
jgi:hypothetical protein